MPFEVPMRRLDIYAVDGRFVRSLVAGTYPTGDHEVAWDGRNAKGRDVAGGVYFARLEAPGQTSVHRFVYLK